MTLNKQPIKQGLRGALDIYLFAMRPFMVRCLRQVKGRQLEDTVRASLKPSQLYPFEQNLSNGKRVKDSLDAGHFAFLIRDNWNDVFCTAFAGDSRVYNLVTNIKHLRNRLAHPSQQDIANDIDPAYGKKCLAQIVDMLARISRPNERQFVEAIAEQLFGSTGVTGANGQAVQASEEETPQDWPQVAAESSVTYWVYEDGPTSRTRIHKATCRFCNDGKGLHGSRLPDNRWIGPIESFEVALETAMETERRDIAKCKICLP